jgi:serine/threonine protein kinase
MPPPSYWTTALRLAADAADAALAAVADALPPDAAAAVDAARVALPRARLPGGVVRGDLVDVGGRRVVVESVVRRAEGAVEGRRCGPTTLADPRHPCPSLPPLQLGEGGFSFVYAVVDESSGTRLALKRVLAGDADAVAAARSEAALAARFCASPRGLLPLVASSEHPTSSPGVMAVCMLSPLCGGGALSAAAAGPTARRDRRHLLAALADAAAGLAALHAAGIAHFDVKPHNVLLQEREERREGEGSATTASYPLSPRWIGRLSDLGSARPVPLALPDRAAAAAAAEWAASCCTAAYRAPELFDPPSGPAAAITAAADVWGLGCTLYAALTGGASPFERDGGRGSMALAVAAGRVAWPPAAGAPPDAVALVAACLRAEPGERPAAAAVAVALDALAVAAAAGD